MSFRLCRKGIIIINSIFNSLKSEKQERIINAAIKEFVQSGFEKASTNEMVKEAEISKGSLFNYFNSKKDLYLYLIEYGVQIIEEIYEQIDLNERDIFKRIEKLGLKKLQIHRRFPHVFDFLSSLRLEESDEVKDDIKQRVDSIFEEGVTKIYENIDYSKFREDIDIQKAIEILNWTMFGFGEKAVNQLTTFEGVGEEYLNEWESYSKILKYSFYK
ncbi:DNA-binding transcriptional regulator, AcrR family [Salinibacillus kushneri]|uniref:DNA-binding transcriptional regulator, AcrR family n=1 Tax=Salinibacillus kushneri TaxID=237682 RepID=A0A1I0A9U6_9BACI|nr:TetR/AcrR family transcriptional regulator [Salinibacillus kushneri]SES90019.1 DNA-binding transcriptional regulator, AcrR family [Salinibacillus kushneri]